MFFRDDKMILRRISDVVSMEWLQVEARGFHNMRYEVTLGSGARVQVDEQNFQIIVNASAYFVPAIPGTILLELIEDEEYQGGSLFEESPIFAWRINADQPLRPVTAIGVFEGNFWYALNPDGTIVGSDGSTFKSREAYVQSMSLKEE